MRWRPRRWGKISRVPSNSAAAARTRKLDLLGKRPVYTREGVGHLWLVDPTDRTLIEAGDDD